MKKRLLQGLTWLTVLAILVFILGSIIPAEEAKGESFVGRIPLAVNLLLQALSKANWLGMLVLTSIYVAYMVWIDSLGTSWVMTRFHSPVKIKEMIPARSITFLIAVFNYQAGQAALLFYLKRIHRIPLLEGTGTLLFIALMDFFILLSLGAIGALFISDVNFAKPIMTVGLLGMAGYMGHGIFWHFESKWKFLIKLRLKIPLLKKIDAKRSLFQTFQKANLKDYGMMLLFRLPVHLAVFAGTFFMFLCFHRYVPISKLFVYMPTVMVITNIPIINVGMVGASQASMVYFFQEEASKEILLAISLMWAFSLNILKVILGGIFLTRYSSKLFQPEGETNIQ